MGYWVYLARCGDNTIYTGAAKDLERRLREHNRESSSGQGAKYTAAHRPVALAQAWEVGAWGDALRLEYAVKQCSRAQKIQLIEEPAGINRIAEKRQLDFEIFVRKQD